MHDVLVRPQKKFAAALLAASVVSAASIVGVPENRSLPIIDIDVANTSVIADWLWNFGDAVNGVGTGVAILPYTALNLPFDVTAAIAAAVQNPSIGPNVLSWLVQRYVNPSNGYPYSSYPQDFKNLSIERLAGLLPYPIGSSIIDAVNQIANAIGGVLSGLPSPTPGQIGATNFWLSDIGRTVSAASQAVTAPVFMVYDTVRYLGYLPANLEGAVEWAIQDPSKIPGLVSGLVHQLVAPWGLLGDQLYNVATPFMTLPGPIGELASNIVKAISDGIDGVLSLLPSPIYGAGPLTVPASVSSSVEPSSLPEASLAVAGGITLKSVDPVEKKSEATDSAVPSAQEPGTSSTAAATPTEAAPAAGIVDPAATPAAADAPRPGAVTSTTDPVKLGNKVTPGDKFDNGAKGEPAKDEPVKANVEGAPTPAGDKVPTADTPAATGPKHGEADGSGASDSAASGEAA